MEFKECDRVTDISIASSVKKIGAKAFFNTGVKKITIPKKAVNLGVWFASKLQKSSGNNDTGRFQCNGT